MSAPVDLYEAFRAYRRRRRTERTLDILCIALALVTLAYFGGQLLRPAF